MIQQTQQTQQPHSQSNRPWIAILLALIGAHVGFGIFATMTGNDIAWLAGAAAVLVVALCLCRMYVIWAY